MTHSEKHKVTKAAGVVGAATLLSRIGGFLRDMVIAYFFGAGPAADAFFVAFRIPNLLRRFFAEGTLTIAFVPTFTELLHNKGKSEAEHLFKSTAGLLGLILTIITALGVWLAPLVVRLMAPGFSPQDETYQLTVTLTRWCMPYILFISLTALAGGVLNSLDHFFAPAFAPVLLNVSLIAAAVWVAPHTDPPVFALALGVVAGGVVQLAFQLPYLKANQIGFWPAWDLKLPELRSIIKLMGPAVFGAAVYQITILMNTVLASLLPMGSVSFLYYAERLIQFPLGIFAIALSTAALPSLSRHAAEKNMDALVDTMLYGLRLTMFIILPAMVGLMVLSQPLVELLYMRGEFSPEDAKATAYALLAYCPGLWAVSSSRGMVQAFYALKDTKTPVKVAAASLVVNLAASLSLMFVMGHVGLALATSLASMANLVGLLWLLSKRLQDLGLGSLLGSAVKMLLASGVMGLGVAALAFGPAWSPGLMQHYIRPLAAIGLGGVLYLGMSLLLKSGELSELKQAVLRR